MSFNKKRKFQGGNANTSNKDTKAAPLLFSRSEKNFTTVLNQLEPELRELFTIAGTMISGRVPDHIRPMAHKLGLWLQFPLPGDTTNASVHILNPTKNTVTVPSGKLTCYRSWIELPLVHHLVVQCRLQQQTTTVQQMEILLHHLTLTE